MIEKAKEVVSRFAVGMIFPILLLLWFIGYIIFLRWLNEECSKK